MIVQFSEVKAADKAANTKANGLWGKMVSYVRFTVPEDMKGLDAKGKPTALSDFLKNREKDAKDEDKKWQPSPAYRSNKSLILRAVRLNVQLVSRDQPRGKTEVQDECNEIEKVELTPYQQFMTAITTVGKKLDKLEHGQKVTAFAAINELATKVRKEIEGATEQKAA